MALTDAPPIVTSLSTQLAACGSWTGGTNNHHYPEAPAAFSVPAAVLDDQAANRRVAFTDAPGLLTGTLVITIIDSATNRTVGQLETFARTILAELLAQVVGIAFRQGDVGLVSDYKPATEAVAGSAARRSITMTITYGLDAP